MLQFVAGNTNYDVGRDNFFFELMDIFYLTEIVCDFPPWFQNPFALTTDDSILHQKRAEE